MWTKFYSYKSGCYKKRWCSRYPMPKGGARRKLGGPA
jgi:hypothetical protein